MVLSHRLRESLPQRLRAARRRQGDFHRASQEWAKSGTTWRRTFSECEQGTDGVALFEGRVIGRVRLLAEAAARVQDAPPQRLDGHRTKQRPPEDLPEPSHQTTLAEANTKRGAWAQRE